MIGHGRDRPRRRWWPRFFRAETRRARCMLSRALVAWAMKHDLQNPKIWNAYARRYRNEMEKTDSRQTIRALAELAKRTPISIRCYCHTANCHRFELERLIRIACGIRSLNRRCRGPGREGGGSLPHPPLRSR